MSSNIKIQRICQQCNNEFTARTTVTKFCSHVCAKKAYKERFRTSKIEGSNKETQQIKSKPFEELKAKEFLTVRDVAALLNCSVRTVYYYIDSNKIKAINLSQRVTRVRRSDLDKLFEQPQPLAFQPENKSEPLQYDISEYYSTEQVRGKYGVSESALRNLIIKYNIPKFRKGLLAYVPKKEIDKLFT